jgi:hypothetical protein
MNKKAIIFAFLLFFVGFLGMTAQQSDKEMIRLEKEAMRIQAQAVASGYIIYVDAATGDDVKGGGTAKKPYKTIGKALAVARSGDTIKVGPGVYSERLIIDTLDRILLEGSGSDSSVINEYVQFDGCKYLEIKGFKFTGGAIGRGLWCNNVDIADVQDCNFQVPSGIGLVLEHNNAMWVYNSQFNCAPYGTGVVTHSYSWLWLENCTVTGNDTGIVTRRGAVTYIVNSTVSNNETWGVWIEQNAELWIQASFFFGNGWAIHCIVGGVINSAQSGDSNKIYGNTYGGIELRTGGTAELSCTEIYNNPTGILVTEAGVLCLIGAPNCIHDNEFGITVEQFGHAFLRNNPINGNTVWDVYIHTGGQATCNPSVISKINSDCPYCHK